MNTASKYHATNQQMDAEFKLIEAAKLDINRFGPLYDKYYKQIFNYLNQRLDDKETAFDVTSQVFLKAMTNLSKYQFKGVPFSSWLYRIAYSELMQLFREKKAQRTVNADVSDLKHLCEEIKENYYDDFLPVLSKVLAELDELELQLVEMRFFEKRPFKEVAEVLELSETNAKVKLHRLLEKIKKSLKNNNSIK
jgi:RNA polymerase sigma-70 factor (ECF subfamily)